MAHVSWGLIIASGKDEQLTADTNTAFLSLGSKPVLAYSLLAYEDCPEIEGVTVVAPKDRMETVVGMVNMFGTTKVKQVVAGTATRRQSLANGMKALADEVTVLSIQDGSRPCVTVDLIRETIKAAKRHGSGVAARHMFGPVAESAKGQTATSVVADGRLWLVEKPQSYRRELLEEALAAAVKKKLSFSDETEAIHLIKKPIRLVPSPPTNLRILRVEDLLLGKALMAQHIRG